MKAPLKTILKNFLDHVEDLETRKKLNDDQYEQEFQELKKLTDKLKEDPAYPCSFGLKDVNRPKNRYKDIVPYDFSRVILPKHEGIPGSDYINASYVKGASGALAYIAAQGPLPNTVIDFWRMIWVCDVQVVIMACNEREAGKFKCEVYWPGPGEKRQYGNISIELVDSSQVCPDFLVRTFLVNCGSEMRDVFQFHYTTWPDHGVPDTVQPILDLVRLMRDCQASETVPIVVHCSAGCGRTGTICAVDYVWACLRHGKLDEDFSLYQIALELRRQRIAMIQTKEQYILAHKAVAAMFEQQLRVIDCHIYENLDEDGEPLIWKEVGKGKEFDVPDFMRKCDTKEKTELTDVHKSPVSPIDSKSNSKFFTTAVKKEKIKELNIGSISHDSSVDSNLNMKATPLDSVNLSSKNSESSFSRNSILSQQSNEDSIPFIDDDDVCVRPNCGRAYLDIPSCDSISKIVNCFDPFVDKVSIISDESSPDGDPIEIINKIKDFQSYSSSKTLDRNAKLSDFSAGENGAQQDVKQADRKSDIVTSSEKFLVLNNRESYPPCTTNDKCMRKMVESVVESEVSESSEDVKGTKRIGKATVVRRPSISKLKALFEKSSASSPRGSNEGSKRLLFRNNSHHVSRAGSAPPSLDCMGKNSAAEKESILRMVTRKFRSSSVRTEREIQSHEHKTLNRKSATDTVKDGFNALTRTMSFSINKTFKSYSLSKIKLENSKCCTSNVSDSIVGIYKPKSPDQPKSNSMWYDRSSLPRAVAVVKPTGKFESEGDTKITSKSPTELKSPDKRKSQESHFNYITKPAKLKDFFSSLNKKDAKDSTTLWYNESNANAPADSEKLTADLLYNATSKQPSKVLPFLPIAPWKKIGPKSPVSSPDSPKGFSEPTTPRSSSTFYANVLEEDSKVINSSTEKSHSNTDVPKCPVPEEIIPLNIDTADNKFWPSNSLSTSFQSTSSEKAENSICKSDMPEQSVNVEQPEKECDAKSAVSDTPPAIPKKMVIGKNKNLQNTPLDIVETHSSPMVEPKCSDNSNETVSEIKASDNGNVKSNTVLEKSDLYMNVNIKAMKNIEQIENTLRKNPRGAIIDLTSRESYSMEEELVNAVNQLSEPSEKPKVVETHEKSKSLSVKTSTKFPGYEVIWPEQSYIVIQKSKSGSKVPLMNKPGDESLLSNHNKTGLCYSPPLRRSINAGVELAKSQSCGNLDWLEPGDPISGLKEQSNTPTKRLVNEAVVELNTLLNQLTTRTLSEDADFNSKSKEKLIICKETPKSNSKEVVGEEIPKDDEKSSACEAIQKRDEKPVVSDNTNGSNDKQTISEDPFKSAEKLIGSEEICKKKEKKIVSEDIRKGLAEIAIGKENHKSKEGLAISKETQANKESSVIGKGTYKNEELIIVEETCKNEEKSILNKETHKSREKLVISAESFKKEEKLKDFNVEPNDTVVHSVTLVTKSYNSGSSPKEEEIVFHFPPPPRGPPPPKGESPVESFNIVCKEGSLIVKEPDNKATTVTCAKRKEDSEISSVGSSSNSSESCVEVDTLQRFPQPAPRKSKQTSSGLQRSSSYSNIGMLQNKNKGYENIFLEKYQTLSRLEIKPQNEEINVLEKVVPIHKFALRPITQNTSIPPNYANISSKDINSVSGSQDASSSAFIKTTELCKRKEEKLDQSISTSNNKTPVENCMMLIDDSDSVYGKILKVSKEKTLITERLDTKSTNLSPSIDVKKKIILSKKVERAPLPPNKKPAEITNNEMAVKATSNDSMIPKKLPSRKLEKAPLPPHLLQKSSSTVNVRHKNLIGPQPYVNFSPVQHTEEKPKLPAVRENVPNVAENSQIFRKNVISDKFVNRGLSHSQSDASVHLAWKERRIQSAIQENKLLNMRSLMSKRTNESVNLSSSDSSDSSSYERIFLTKEDLIKPIAKSIPRETNEPSSVKSYRKEVPVAPPRSKRRSTTEVQYSRVKAKDASHTSISQLRGQMEIKNFKGTLPTSEDGPPAIPMKTRDAFEIPEM